MAYKLSADLVVLLHFGFVVFVIAGGLLVTRRHWLALLHLPAVIWAAMLEFRGWICPLTPLENSLRQAAGESGYQGGFVEHYLLPVLYPASLYARMQTLIGSFVILINVALYARVLIVRRRQQKDSSETTN